jgi:hypothetical protein
MKHRILNFGSTATHDRITALENLAMPLSISDFDAFLIDPLVLSNVTTDHASFHRRRAEIRDLIARKRGMVICMMRVGRPTQVGPPTGLVSRYSLLDLAYPSLLSFIQHSLKDGVGTQWELVRNSKGPSQEYFRGLQGKLCFEAYLEANTAQIASLAGTIFAMNSANYPLAAEFAVDEGRICLVPIPDSNIPKGQLGMTIVRMVQAHFGGTGEIELPEWAGDIRVPGADVNNLRILELETKKKELEEEVGKLNEERNALLSHKVLLFGSGQAVLERAVRRALRLFGFVVPEPEEYEGEWDVDLTDSTTGKSAVGEIEGSEGAVNIDKLRQLLEYVESEQDAGRNRKGILVGNGYRLKKPDEREARNQFTEKAQVRAKGFEYCLLPTTELFEAVCAVLSAPSDEGLKTRIRESIISKIGVWIVSQDLPSISPT